MKRRLITLTLACILILSLAVSVSADTGAFFLVDDADLLSSSEESRLAAKLEEISREYGAQILVVTVNSVPGRNIDRYVEDYYDSNGLGYGNNYDGVLLLICMDIREYRILSNGLAADAIGDSEIDAIGDQITPDLSDGEYADAFSLFADRCAYYLDGHINGFPFDFGGSLGIALIIGICAGLIVALILRGQLKTVRRQNQANVYVKPGSMQVTTRNDIFLYRNVTRTKRETSSNSSRAGSSRHVGGGKF